MNSGQTLLTFGALILLTIAILNFNKTLSYHDISLSQNRYKLEAISLLTSYIEQTSQYFFDEATTDTSSGKDLPDFTPPANLGFDGNDNGVIDDFDDFNNYTVIDTGISGLAYKINFNVTYVRLNNGQLLPSSSKQYSKMMTIKITDNYSDPLLFKYVNGEKVRDTLQISFVNTYWFYD